MRHRERHELQVCQVDTLAVAGGVEEAFPFARPDGHLGSMAHPYRYFEAPRKGRRAADVVSVFMGDEHCINV